MTATQIALDKKTHPLMMHLSILPKYGISDELFSYDPNSQTSNSSAMSNSWCTRNGSTPNLWTPDDTDQKEDD